MSITQIMSTPDKPTAIVLYTTKSLRTFRQGKYAKYEKKWGDVWREISEEIRYNIYPSANKYRSDHDERSEDILTYAPLIKIVNKWIEEGLTLKLGDVFKITWELGGRYQAWLPICYWDGNKLANNGIFGHCYIPTDIYYPRYSMDYYDNIYAAFALSPDLLSYVREHSSPSSEAIDIGGT